MKLSSQTAHALPFRVKDGPVPTIKDHVVPGLILRANSDTKSWLFYYRTDAGVQRKPKLGEFPVMGIDAARQRAKEIKEAAWRGEDPSAARKANRAAPTMKELAELYLADRQRAVNAGLWKPWTLKHYTHAVHRYIVPALGSKKVAGVTYDDVEHMLENIGVDKPTMANRVKATLSSMFRFAERKQLRPKRSNPTLDTVTFRERKRRRVATEAECIGMFQELAELRMQFPGEVAALLVILYAGTRVTELITAQRSQLQGHTIVLEKHKTDQDGEPRVIHLPRQARMLIESLPDDGSGYIFGEGLTQRKVFKVWEAARKKVGCNDLRVMDLRRTFASAAKSAGVSLEQIGGVLGHRHQKTTEHYAFLFHEATQRVVQSTADELERRMLPPPTPLPGE